ncbi:amino acid adenylation domain-containing protein [Nonomuraea sp. NPDC055795]
MSGLSERLAKLTPEQRSLLDARLKGLNAAPPELRRVPKRTRRDRVRLTVDQERIWLIHQFDPADPVYNVHFGIRLRGALDVRAMERAVNAFVERHEAMRTTFETEDLRPVMVLHDAMPITVRHEDLRDVARERREAEMLRVANDEVSRPFDLAKGPLLRITLIRLADREHVMVINVDHLVWDRGVTGIFEAEVAELYTAFVTGRAPELAELPIQYADYAAWQPLWLREEVSRRHLPYWKKTLEGAPMALELPADRPRPPVQTFNGARYQFRMTRELTLAIKELARREDVTVNVALLAAWQLLLHRYTGQGDIVLGTTSSTRSRPETEPVVGYFLTMLPLRTHVGGEMTFRELLRATRATMVGAFEHHDTPFGTLLDELDVPRDPSRNPLYQVSFIFVDFNEDPVRMAGLGVGPVTFDNHSAKDDCMLCIWDEEALADHFFGLFEYNTDLFDEATLARMWRHLERVLEQVVADPGARVGELSLTAPDEVATLVSDWNRTHAEREPGVCLEELVRRQARATPDAVAVSCGPDRLTYAQLVDRAARLAGELRGRGVRCEDVVGVCAERSCELVAGLLGVLMSGAAYLPMDPDFPPGRLAAMAADAGARIVLTQSRLLDRLDAAQGERVLLDREPAGPPYPGEPELDGERLAYVIYTSGSTGRPKGVEITHRSLVNLLEAMADEVGLGHGDVLAAVTSISFDIAGLELYAPLIRGARVVLVPRERAADARGLAALLGACGATVVQATPATWHLLTEAGWRNDGGLRVITGGEALPPALARELAGRPGLTWNVYGPTETTIWSTARRMDSGSEAVSIGRPLANTQVYVLDELLRPVPVGMPGELVIGGAGLARGYRGHPALTSERFVPDHLGGEPGARLYRTGDQVRYRPDGNLVFLGRDDGQVKLRGFRIELGEIESRLAACPGVGRAVALVREDRPGDRRLVAYHTGERVPPEQLREHMGAFLPDYMIPSAFVRLDAFPLNTSGKLDRRALPAPSHRPGGDYVAPRDPVELEVAKIWEDVLGARPVGLHDRFFDLGGHSLLVLRLMAEIERRFGRELPMAAIFQGATVERFARVLRDGYRQEEREHLVELRPGTGRPLFFAHPAGSEVVCYMPFAKLLKPDDRPLFAIASPPVRDGAFPYASFEERAAAYAALIRAKQPEGPYDLTGWCYGGINGFAIARELERQGQHVSLLLLDAYGPEEIPQGEDPGRAAIVEGLALNLEWDRAAELKPLDELSAMSDEDHLTYLVELARGGDYLPPDSGREQVNTFLELWTANLRLMWRYRPTPMRGTLTLIRAAEEEPSLFDTWRPLASKGLEVRVVPGNHYTMMREPRIADLALAVNDHLARPGVADA